MAVVRISKCTFDLDRLAEVERRLAESEPALRAPLDALPGLIHYYVGIDRQEASVTNLSVWDTPEHAHQMDDLRPMIAQRPILEGVGVSFEPITNHQTLWTINP